MGYRWTGDVLFATSSNERFKKAKLRFREKNSEVEAGFAMGVMRANYKVDYGDLDGYLRKDDTLELHLRTADGLGQRWLLKTPSADELVSMLSEMNIQEKPRSLEPEPVITQRRPTGSDVSGKAPSPAVKFGLAPGK